MTEMNYPHLGEVDPDEQCCLAIEHVHAFLHGELPSTCADSVREHLMACEHCMDHFDLEQCITALVKRAHQPQMAPESLKVRISQMTITYR